jgi:pimeloyl-ACP methyl ester carboxylesterase
MTVVLVHGLWHGGWTFDRVRELLDDAGVPSIAPELPLTSLPDDVAVVRNLLDRLDGPVVLVGHSYGGAVITAAGDHACVQRLIYLAAFALTEAESVNSVLPERQIAPTRLGTALEVSDDGTQISLNPERGMPLLYNGVSTAEIASAVPRLRPVNRAVFSGRPAAVAWRSKPATYAVCTEDRAVAPELQRAMAERVREAVYWPSGHMCPLSHPQLVAALVQICHMPQR